MNRLLHHDHGLRIAVIVNDMSELNVDARLIKDNTYFKESEEKLVEMSNGCICLHIARRLALRNC